MEGSRKKQNNERKIKFRLNVLDSGSKSNWWIYTIIVTTFIISVILSLVSSKVLEKSNYIISCIVVVVIIFISIIFDIIGTAVTAADETPFHAMASRKLYGARQSIRLIRNADKVSNLCNDVVGDICGIISGAASTFIISEIVTTGLNPQTSILGLMITGFVASLTVGGKSLGKTIAIRNSNSIVYKVAVVLQVFVINFSRKRKNRIKKDGK